MVDFMNGERFQQIAEMYLGTAGDFLYNPLIFEQMEKHQILDDIDGPFDNPPTLFLYAHLLEPFSKKLQHFRNPFTLITHNSDFNLLESDPTIKKILESETVVCWWGQISVLSILKCGFCQSVWPIPCGTTAK